jgi:hypothetical protein
MFKSLAKATQRVLQWQTNTRPRMDPGWGDECEPEVIRVTVVGGGAVHGVEVSKERTQFFNGEDVITRLHQPIII